MASLGTVASSIASLFDELFPPLLGCKHPYLVKKRLFKPIQTIIAYLLSLSTLIIFPQITPTNKRNPPLIVRVR